MDASSLSCAASDLAARVYRIFNRVTPVPTGTSLRGITAVRTGNVNFFLAGWEGGLFCVDAGENPPVVRRELGRLGIDPDAVTHVLLTHSDYDHAGGLPVFSRARVLLPERELPLAAGRLPRSHRVVYNHVPLRRIMLLRTGGTVRLGGRVIRTIPAPGHTPGSTCYLLDGGNLFTGDVFRVIGGAARPNRPIVTMDMEENLRTIRRLARLGGVEALFTAHRGIYTKYETIMESWR